MSSAGKPRRWLESLLLLIGVALLAYYTTVSVENDLYQAMENRELDAILQTSPKGILQPSAEGTHQSTSEQLTLRPRVAVGSTLGRLEIPRLGVAVVVRAGSDARTLRLAVGHIPGTAWPGDGGNIGLAGHRDTFFRRLRNIQIDDELRLVTADGNYRFRVEDTIVVSPGDTWVLAPTKTSTVTLVTCYPFSYVGSAPNRFIVRAIAEPREASSPNF